MKRARSVVAKPIVSSCGGEPERFNPFRVGGVDGSETQGSPGRATLGWKIQSRWDWGGPGSGGWRKDRTRVGADGSEVRWCDGAMVRWCDGAMVRHEAVRP